MKYSEFITKLTLFDKFVIGTRKGVSDELIIGIPCNDQKRFYPVYTISAELAHNTEDFSMIYNYIHAFIKQNIKVLSERIDILEKIEIANAT